MIIKNNITPKIKEKIGKNLHNKENHPIEIIKNKIYKYFGHEFKKFDFLQPKVSVTENFDNLLIKPEHPSRRMSDTYYIDNNTVLRTHTSAHQNELLKQGYKKFLVTGDVYRKDEIDTKHYPVFHQTEGVCIIEGNKNPEEELVRMLSRLIEGLFPNCKYRFNKDYFPFTNPSFEVEVQFVDSNWMEVLGCGIVHEKIMSNCGLNGQKAWAFGLGLERLAMVLFNIPDIRYFWSEDKRFLKQFENGKETLFQPYSKYPAITRDISFWIDEEKYSYNDFCEILRNSGSEGNYDLIESIELKDKFINPKTQKQSLCFRIIYRSNDRTLTSEEVDKIQQEIKEKIVSELNVVLR